MGTEGKSSFDKIKGWFFLRTQMHTIWKLREEENRDEVLTDLQELHIIEMTKAKVEYEKDPNNILAQWILFILNPNDKEVKFIMKEMEEIIERANIYIRKL